jgi:predicted transcriptional regulator YdeE
MKTHRAVLASFAAVAVLFSASLLPQAGAQAVNAAVASQTQAAFTVIGLSVRTDNQKEAGGNGLIPQMWQRAMQEGLLENIPHRADNNLTVVYTDYTAKPGEYTYVLGVRVSTVDKLPDGMISVNVPAGKYAIVDSDKGSLPEVLPKVWQRIFAMPATELGGERAFKADYEVYPEGFDWQNAQIPVYLGLK